MVAFALVVPFAGTALAAHVTALDVTPNSDTAPANTCNAFTVTLTGPQAAGDTNPGVPGETVDVTVTDTDADNTATTAVNEAQSNIEFCRPPAGNDPTGAETGQNPYEQSNVDAQGVTGGASQRHAEFGLTDANGNLTFGVTTATAGNFSVTVFYEETNDNDNPGGDLAETVTKTFTAPPATGNEGVRTLDCEPETDTNPEGTAHSFNCVARDANQNPVSGATIQFDVTAGPNAEEVAPTNCGASTTNATTGVTTVTGGPTGANGQATCTYTDAEQVDTVTTADPSPPGTDTIIGFVNQTPGAGQTGTPGADAFEPQDEIRKTWVGDANNIQCTPDNGTANSGDIVTITCTVTDEAGQPVPGVQVNFTENGAGTFRQPGGTQTAITNAQGVATVELITGQTEEGTVSVTGTIVDRADDPATTANEANDTNCVGATGNAETGTNADCSDTATVVVTEAGPDPDPDPECSDGVDNDNDGFTDFPDDPDCDSPEDDSESDVGGRFASNISIRYDRDAQPPAFKGKVGSARRECKQGRQVLLKKARPGRDRVVGRDTTNRRGNWLIAKRRARGRFYAVVRAANKNSESGAALVCGRDRSVTIRITRRG